MDAKIFLVLALAMSGPSDDPDKVYSDVIWTGTWESHGRQEWVAFDCSGDSEIDAEDLSARECSRFGAALRRHDPNVRFVCRQEMLSTYCDDRAMFEFYLTAPDVWMSTSSQIGEHSRWRPSRC